MANDLNTNPLKVDTAATVKSSSVTCLKIVWDGPTTAAHTLTVTDLNDRVVWNRTVPTNGNGAGFQYFIDIPRGSARFNGLKVSTIDSGTAYFFVE